MLMQSILAGKAVSLSELKKNPSAGLKASGYRLVYQLIEEPVVACVVAVGKRQRTAV
nr:hypothetical protein FFPRI1PSEUD_03690 [Pseudomonas sp. FFPRI_1]